jgi:hypothetical protein
LLPTHLERRKNVKNLRMIWPMAGVALLFCLASEANALPDAGGAPPFLACHASVGAKGVEVCPETKPSSMDPRFAAVQLCNPGECVVRVYQEAPRGGHVSGTDDPYCGGPPRQASCVTIRASIPPGATITRHQLYAADAEMNDCNGGGGCPQNSNTCKPLPWSRFVNYREEKDNGGGTTVSVMFKNWRDDATRRGGLVVWYTPKDSQHPFVDKHLPTGGRCLGGQ